MPLVTQPDVYISQSSGVTVTLGSVAVCVKQGSYSVEIDSDDTTNSCSGGWKESVPTVRVATGTLMVAWKSASPPEWIEGPIYALVADINGANYLSGNVRLTKIDYPGGTPTEGIFISMAWKSEGPMTRTRP